MSTVAAIVERLYRTYLYPPDARPAQCLLNGSLTSAATSFSVDGFVLPEDETLLANGVVLEVESELIQVLGYDSVTTTVTDAIRGFMGTTAASHGDNTPVLLSPPYPRLSVFEAVADNIITLYPRLYTVNSGSLVPVAGGIAALDDNLAVDVVEAWPDEFRSADSVSARIVDYHPAVGGRALVTSLQVGHVWVRYRRRFGDAQSESDTYVSLGLEERWVNIVMAGAAADLFAGRDLPASHTDWVGAALQAENIPVGTRADLSRRLAAYREHLITQAAKEMRAEYRSQTYMRSPSQVTTRSAFG